MTPMAKVLSTRTTYAPHMGLPELTGGEPITIPDDLLPLALSLRGVVEVEDPAPKALEVPEVPAIPVVPVVPNPDLPETAWENQPHPEVNP